MDENWHFNHIMIT